MANTAALISSSTGQAGDPCAACACQAGLHRAVGSARGLAAAVELCCFTAVGCHVQVLQASGLRAGVIEESSNLRRSWWELFFSASSIICGRILHLDILLLAGLRVSRLCQRKKQSARTIDWTSHLLVLVSLTDALLGEQRSTLCVSMERQCWGNPFCIFTLSIILKATVRLHLLPCWWGSSWRTAHWELLSRACCSAALGSMTWAQSTGTCCLGMWSRSNRGPYSIRHCEIPSKLGTFNRWFSILEIHDHMQFKKLYLFWCF